MIHFVRGKIFDIRESKVIVENNGIGYEINISTSTMALLPGLNQDVFLYTYLQVREDGFTLFGFLKKEELNMFNLLITVSGIGPKSAINILSIGTAESLMVAIISEDVKELGKYPGIGKKTAGRLILELKDKINTADAVPSGGKDDILVSPVQNDSKTDAVSALVALGYNRGEAFKTVLSVWEENMAVEMIIKLSLKAFASK